jgi:Ca2+-binding EF-hand superfamily protein
MDELKVAFKQVGFECSMAEVHQIFADENAAATNYIPMDQFFKRVAQSPHC